MENYQMFFPCSSSSSSMAVSGYPAHHHHHHQVSSSIMESSHNNEGYGRDSNGFLGLGTESNNHNHKMMMMMTMNNKNKSPDHDDDDGELGKSSSSSATVTDNNNSGKKGVKKVKKPKYAFQTRSQVDILDDGYRWRKYGQKAVKNNTFPRSYYRCTHNGCNVKKQVQRLSKDEGVVVTTYEGMHTHPIEKHTDNFEHILNQMHIYTPF